jgi:hypothetical protein
MRVLLDESLPRGLRKGLLGHEVKTVGDMNWRSIKNGSLLALAEPLFDVLITADRNMQYQQNLAKFKSLFDYLLGGKTLADFLKDNPSVNREQALAVLEFGKNMLLEEVYENAAKVAAQNNKE